MRLSAVTSFGLTGILGLLTCGVLPVYGGEPEKTHLLRTARQPGIIDHVVVVLEVAGEMKESADAKSKPVPMNLVCNLTYDEKTLEVPSTAEGRWRSVRCYDTATTVGKIGDDEYKPTLRPQRSLIAAQIDAGDAVLFSPRGPLTRDELEVIDVLGNSLILERLLPQQPVDVGESWKPTDAVLAMLLSLDTVRKNNLQCVLKEVTGNVARFEMSGRVEGTKDDVSTTVELKAKYRFDLRIRRMDWLGMVIKERRSVSQVGFAFDVTARLQVRITPQDASAALEEAVLKELALEASPEALKLEYESPDGRLRLTHDRSWHLTGTHRDLAIFRLVDQGDYVAQCNLSPLVERKPEELPSLEQFQQDIRRALEKSFGEFVQAGESVDEENRRVYRVVIQGKASAPASKGKSSDVPIQWNYYLVADQQGRQAVFAFTVEQELAERLKGADETLVRAVRFLAPKAPAAKKPATKQADDTK